MGSVRDGVNRMGGVGRTRVVCAGVACDANADGRDG
jgi:hypothetical protein